MPPELVRELNKKQLDHLKNKVDIDFIKGSPEERKYKMQLRLMKKLNENEYRNTMSQKRKNSRFG